MAATRAPWTSRDRRPPAVAGSFYPADPHRLAALVDEQVEAAGRLGTLDPVPAAARLRGLLVPHAGLVYSGLVAAAAWRRLPVRPSPTVVILGTNHSAPWLRGIGAWDRGTWMTPLGEIAVDEPLADAILAAGPPFRRDEEAHLGEHSIEVQLPFVRRLAPDARVVPLAVSTGTGRAALDAGRLLGELLAGRLAQGDPVLLVASSDAAHYPDAAAAEWVNDRLLEPLRAVDPERLAEVDESIRGSGRRGLVCAMCGIEPSVVALAALRSMGVRSGRALLAATSADAGGGADRTVGYLAVAFTD